MYWLLSDCSVVYADRRRRDLRRHSERTTRMCESFAAQGGGTVTWDEASRAWRFVTPPDWGDWIAGDLMPDEWGVAGPIKE
jgi:hypothetical protein